MTHYVVSPSRVLESGPAVASWGVNRLDCFAKGQKNHMNGAVWSIWEDLGGVIDGTPAAVSPGPNRTAGFILSTP